MSAFLVSSPNPTQLLSKNLICPNQSSLFCNLKGVRRNLLFQSSVSPLMQNSHLICGCRHPLRISAQRPDSDVSPFPMPSPTPSTAALGKVFHGQCFVVDGNIDTDQIIPAEYLTLVPSKPDEYEKLGSYAMVGLPVRYGRFIEEGQTKTRYPIIIAGANFGCGSSREHAPVALGAAGVRAIVAESYARIFFRNSVATGELYPVESESTVWTECKTGDYVTIDLINNVLINHTQNSKFALKPIGDAGPVIDAGGIFAYARKTGMIASQAA